MVAHKVSLPRDVGDVAGATAGYQALVDQPIAACRHVAEVEVVLLDDVELEEARRREDSVARRTAVPVRTLVVGFALPVRGELTLAATHAAHDRSGVHCFSFHAVAAREVWNERPLAAHRGRQVALVKKGVVEHV